jgi:hypothetical protein
MHPRIPLFLHTQKNPECKTGEKEKSLRMESNDSFDSNKRSVAGLSMDNSM